MSDIFCLPREIIIHNILGYMSAKELFVISQVNKEFKLLCQNESLWKKLTRKDFDEPNKIKNTWYLTYIYLNKYDQIYLLWEYNNYDNYEKDDYKDRAYSYDNTFQYDVKVFLSMDLAINYMVKNINPESLAGTCNDFYNSFCKKYSGSDKYFSDKLIASYTLAKGYQPYQHMLKYSQMSKNYHNYILNIYYKELSLYLKNIAYYDKLKKIYEYQLSDDSYKWYFAIKKDRIIKH